MSLFLRKYSKTLSTYVPRLPVMEYNQVPGSKFDNNLKVSRPTLNAENFYQFYAEQRKYMQSIGERIADTKGNMLRDFNIIGVKSLINKYK